MTPTEIVHQFLPPRYFQGAVYDNLRELTIKAIQRYGDARAAEEKEKACEIVTKVLTDYDLACSDDTLLVRDCAEEIVAAIRAPSAPRSLPSTSPDG